MKTKFFRLVKLIAGWSLVLLGIIGWFTPILPGTLFILLGFALLSSESEWVRQKIESWKARFPRQAAKLEAVKESLVSKIGRKEKT